MSAWKRQPTAHEAGCVHIEAGDVHKMVGRVVHVGRLKVGCVWVLESVEGDSVVLRTPKTGRRMRANRSDLYYVRRQEPVQPDAGRRP